MRDAMWTIEQIDLSIRKYMDSILINEKFAKECYKNVVLLEEAKAIIQNQVYEEDRDELKKTCADLNIPTDAPIDELRQKAIDKIKGMSQPEFDDLFEDRVIWLLRDTIHDIVYG